MDLIITTPNEISQIVTKAVTIAISNIQSPQEIELERLDINAAVSLTGLSKSAIYKLTMDSKIPFSRFGGKLVFSRKDLISWMESRTVANIPISRKVSKSLTKQAKKGRAL